MLAGTYHYSSHYSTIRLPYSSVLSFSRYGTTRERGSTRNYSDTTAETTRPIKTFVSDINGISFEGYLPSKNLFLVMIKEHKLDECDIPYVTEPYTNIINYLRGRIQVSCRSGDQILVQKYVKEIHKFCSAHISQLKKTSRRHSIQFDLCFSHVRSSLPPLSLLPFILNNFSQDRRFSSYFMETLERNLR